ncbi:MAG: hypothetical protein JO323_13300 [Acidobacteriia bacterium]|nr:hypothetical protein [Terriglobia bacterium]
MKVSNPFRFSTGRLAAGVLLSAAVVLAQNPGWRRADEPAPAPTADPSTPVAQPDDAGIPTGQPPAEPPANSGVPTRLTIPTGKFIVVRIAQPLSSDRSQVGDFFTATLAEPIVVDGIVVAHRGQTLSGRVSQVDKGGRVAGVAKLGVQLTELTAVDGQQLPIQTQFVGRSAPSTVGRDAGIVAGTTAVGAAAGAAADWGRGAAIGAGAGAALGLAGVLLSHGAPAVLYPESLLSFRLEQPVSVDTERAPQAFQPVNPNEYQQQPGLRTGPGGPGAPPVGGPGPYPYSGYGYAPYPYAYAPYPYYGGYYPYYWGPGFGVVIGGPRYYYRGGRFYRR